MTNLFAPAVEKIGTSIINDDIESFITSYKSKLKIEDQKLLLFCIECGAINITNYIIKNYNNEFKSLTNKEKHKFYYTMMNNKYCKAQPLFIKEMIFYTITSYKISKEILNNLLFYSLKWSSLDVVNAIINQKAYLNKKLIIELINWTKENNLNNDRKSIIINYIVNNIEFNKFFIFNLLSLSVSEDKYKYCIEIDIYENMSALQQNMWKNYLFKANNMEFHLHQTFSNALKKNGFNKYDYNIDFLYFLIYYVFPSFEELDANLINKIIKLKNKLINESSLEELMINFIKKIDIVILKNKLNIEMNKKNEQKRKIKI